MPVPDCPASGQSGTGTGMKRSANAGTCPVPFEEFLGTPARLSLTAIDFAQKQSGHNIFFSFKVRGYKI
jgi:hypothetical protein